MFTALLIGLALCAAVGILAEAPTYDSTSFPAWFKDYGSRDHILPGGVRIAPSLFGRRDAVTATVSVAGAAAAATSVPVGALSGKIPVGTVLDFGTETFNVVVGAAGAAQAATVLPVDALTGPLPNGTVLDFGGAKFARLTAAAAAGAVSLTVAALPTALVDNDSAAFVSPRRTVTLTAAAPKGATSITTTALPYRVLQNVTAAFNGTGPVYVKGGTLIGRTFAERAARTPFGPWAPGDDEVFLIWADVYDAEANADADVIRANSVIAENLLPDWATLTNDQKAAIRATYTTTLGQP